MSEDLFQPMYLLWIGLITLMIVWSWEAWKHWCTTRRAHDKFHKIMHQSCFTKFFDSQIQ